MAAILNASSPRPTIVARLPLQPAQLMTLKFTPEEEAEIELMLWEYDRDGKIAIDNFFRRERKLSLRMASGVIPKRMQQDLIAFLKQRSRVSEAPAVRREAEEEWGRLADPDPQTTGPGNAWV
jgi:hypothetical protein